MTQTIDRGELSRVAPFHRHLGVRSIAAADGRSLVEVEPFEVTRNTRGDAHGGLIAGIMDIAMSRAVRSACLDAWGLSTVSLTVNFLEPGRGALTARGRVLRAGGAIAAAEATIEDSQARIIARASAVFRILRRGPPQAAASGQEDAR